MQQFDLSVWLSDQSRKIITRDGRPVRIVCWDSPNKTFPIVGFVDNGPEIFVWDCFGYCREGHIESEFDLFFADEDGLTEFEITLSEIIDFWQRDNSSVLKTQSKLKSDAKILLDLARKELSLVDNTCGEYALNEAYKQDALKDLPKWKKITKREQNYLAYGYLSHDGYYLSIQELKDKLQKEE